MSTNYSPFCSHTEESLALEKEIERLRKKNNENEKIELYCDDFFIDVWTTYKVKKQMDHDGCYSLQSFIRILEKDSKRPEEKKYMRFPASSNLPDSTTSGKKVTSSAKQTKDPNLCAIKIQALFRGYLARNLYGFQEEITEIINLGLDSDADG